MLKQDLAEAQRKLKIADQPKITQDQMDDLIDAIHTLLSTMLTLRIAITMTWILKLITTIVLL